MAVMRWKSCSCASAQAVLDARAIYLPSLASGESQARGAKPGDGEQSKPTNKGATLVDLYDPLTMPPELVKAHQALDKAVDAAYGMKNFASEAACVAFLFERYQSLTVKI